MKAILVFLIFAVVLCSTNLIAHEASKSAIAANTCTLNNQSSDPLGLVVLSSGSDSSLVPINGLGIYTSPVENTVSSITINGQRLVEPDSGPITLPDGLKVQVQWPSANLIEVINKSGNE
jgi:hypothetical protein